MTIQNSSSSDVSPRSLDCRRVRRALESVDVLAADEEGLARESFVQQHLSCCTDCQQFAAEEAKLCNMFKALPQSTVSSGFSVKVMGQIRHRSPKRKPAMFLRSIAAGFAILVSAGFLTMIVNHNNTVHNPAIPYSVAINSTEVENTEASNLLASNNLSSDSSAELTDSLKGCSRLLKAVPL